MIAGDQVSVSVLVDVAPDVAFSVFTEEIDQWWRRGVAYRIAGKRPGTLVLECKLGGRLFEQYETKAGSRLFETGKVTAWDPPKHLAFEWRGANFKEGEVTFVEVTFTPTESGKTYVALVHRGFAAIRPDHPVRHGEPPAAFLANMGRWWGGLLTSLREYAAR